jgi:hypothetical protein
VLDVGRRGERVLHDVVEQPGAHARGVELQIRDDAGDRGGVGEVRVPALAHLPFVRVEAVLVRSSDELDIGAGVIGADTVGEFRELQHRYGDAGRAQRLVAR